MSISSSEKENGESAGKNYPSEAHIKLEYRAYKTEMEERFSELLLADETSVVDKVLSLKSSRYAQMWQRVTKEAEKQSQESEKVKEAISEADLLKVTAREYLDATIFPVLLPALEVTLRRAEENDCLKVQKCRFNGIDYIVEQLWNRNPKHSERASAWKTVFEIPFVKEWLAKHPRPIYPKSWLWSREEASVVIQSGYRGYLVRRIPEVQEMRQFWKALEAERQEALRKKEEAQQEFISIMQRDNVEQSSVDISSTSSTVKQDEPE